MAKMVKVEALKTAVTTVRVGVTRQIVVTNEDKAGAKAAEEAGEQNAHTFFTTPEVAEQLERKGVVKILSEKDEDGEPGSTIASEAANRLEENAKVDAKAHESTSGATTRDTTAFARRPLSRTGQSTAALAGGATGADTGSGGEEADDADAPPAGDDGAGDAASKPAAKPASKPSAAKS